MSGLSLLLLFACFANDVTVHVCYLCSYNVSPVATSGPLFLSSRMREPLCYLASLLVVPFLASFFLINPANAKKHGCRDDKDCIVGTVCVNSKCLTVPCKDVEICKSIGGSTHSYVKKRRCHKGTCTRKKAAALVHKNTRSPGSKCRQGCVTTRPIFHNFKSWEMSIEESYTHFNGLSAAFVM